MLIFSVSFFQLFKLFIQSPLGLISVADFWNTSAWCCVLYYVLNLMFVLNLLYLSWRWYIDTSWLFTCSAHTGLVLDLETSQLRTHSTHTGLSVLVSTTVNRHVTTPSYFIKGICSFYSVVLVMNLLACSISVGSVSYCQRSLFILFTSSCHDSHYSSFFLLVLSPWSIVFVCSQIVAIDWYGRGCYCELCSFLDSAFK